MFPKRHKTLKLHLLAEKIFQKPVKSVLCILNFSPVFMKNVNKARLLRFIAINERIIYECYKLFSLPLCLLFAFCFLFSYTKSTSKFLWSEILLTSGWYTNDIKSTKGEINFALETKSLISCNQIWENSELQWYWDHYKRLSFISPDALSSIYVYLKLYSNLQWIIIRPLFYVQTWSK